MATPESVPLIPRRKKIPCLYCGMLQSCFARHIERRHITEPRVRRILEKCGTYEGTAKRNAYRRRAFRVLAYKGTATYNENIIKQPGKGLADLVPVRRSKSGVTRHYKQCPNCQGLFRRLARHKCPKKRRRQTTRDITVKPRSLAAAKMLMPDLNISKTLMDILAAIRDGVIKRAIFTDRLLLYWSDNEVRKYITNLDSSSTEDEEESPESRKARRHHRRYLQKSVTYKLRNESRGDILRKQLRLLARFIIKYRKKYGKPDFSLMDAFRVDYVRYASQAIRRVTCDYTKVELAKKLCTWLSKLELGDW